MFTLLEKSYRHLDPFMCLHVFAILKHVATSKVWIQYDQSLKMTNVDLYWQDSTL